LRAAGWPTLQPFVRAGNGELRRRRTVESRRDMAQPRRSVPGCRRFAFPRSARDLRSLTVTPLDKSAVVDLSLRCPKSLWHRS
jgi:hypothetical protein